ncbi:phosphopantetheine-binding protein [Colwellia psychrerythraea]|uniref:Acyl carrier protein familyprotein n=1 Tax=Colwellia psychrerythraea TaxID=28229 RepID=A0A099KQG3_COLPS|nr:phosphopantetheine-binding protein [Colwellia psychrerythraea]KGJ92726.1 acyl carrier protein familyprotein [Colwellia psychrerythraea]
MTSAQAFEQTTEQSREQTIAQLIKLLIAIIPSYDESFWNVDTELFGAIAEFDSMALVTLIGEIEESFDIDFDDDDISAENFFSVASLADLVLEQS